MTSILQVCLTAYAEEDSGPAESGGSLLTEGSDTLREVIGIEQSRLVVGLEVQNVQRVPWRPGKHPLDGSQRERRARRQPGGVLERSL